MKSEDSHYNGQADKNKWLKMLDIKGERWKGSTSRGECLMDEMEGGVNSMEQQKVANEIKSENLRYKGQPDNNIIII